MNATEVTNKLRICEKSIFIIGLLLALALAAVWLYNATFYFSTILGYYLGCLSFIVLVEEFIVLEKAPAWVNVPALVFSNLKLFFLGVAVFLFMRLGFALKQMVIGIFVSQLAVLIVAIWMLKSAKKGVDI